MKEMLDIMHHRFQEDGCQAGHGAHNDTDNNEKILVADMAMAPIVDPVEKEAKGHTLM